MNGKRIALCGSRGAGKGELLESYEGNVITNGNIKLDRLADYRDEIRLALERSDQLQDLIPAVYESSLIDSIGYAATRISYIINDGTGSEDDLTRWQLAMHTAARFLRDGWRYDAVIFVPGHDPEEFYQRLEEAIYTAIWEFLPDNVEKFKLESKDPLQRAEEVATIVEEVNATGTTDPESDGEDS